MERRLHVHDFELMPQGLLTYTHALCHREGVERRILIEGPVLFEKQNGFFRKKERRRLHDSAPPVAEVSCDFELSDPLLCCLTAPVKMEGSDVV